MYKFQIILSILILEVHFKSCSLPGKNPASLFRTKGILGRRRQRRAELAKIEIVNPRLHRRVHVGKEIRGATIIEDSCKTRFCRARLKIYSDNFAPRPFDFISWKIRAFDCSWLRGWRARHTDLEYPDGISITVYVIENYAIKA